MSISPKVLKILHINTERTFRGGEVQTMLLAKELAKRGHVNALVAQPDSPLAARARKEAFTVIETAMHGDLDIFAGRNIRQCIKRFEPDILHAHNPHAGALALWARLPEKKPPVVLSRRVGLPIKSNLLSRIKYRAVDGLLAISHAVKDGLLGSGIAANKIFVAESCTDFATLAPTILRNEMRSALDIPKDAFVIGNVAHFDHHKGQHLLIECFANFAREHTGGDIRLLLVGQGPLLASCRAQAEAAGISEQVVFTGQRTDMGNLYPVMDVFFLSTFTPLEGWSVAMTEAMGCGLAVIAVKYPVTAERIQHEQNGLLVSPGNRKEWGQALRKLAGDSKLCRQLAENAQTYARQFTPERLANKTEACYRTLLEHP